MRARVLVVDDKPNFRRLFHDILAPDFAVQTAEDGARALVMLAAEDFDVVVSDIRMPGMDGFSLLEEAKRLRPHVEVILVTAYGSIPKAVDAMKAGAYHYLTKPIEPDEVLMLVGRAAERRALRRAAEATEVEAESFGALVAKSATMRHVFALLARAAASDATVLVSGESGTGKELAARALHAESARCERRFVAVNCGAIPESLIESELFGHEKGAFTGATSTRLGLFEEAEGGTIFLDEIGDLPLPMQVKLTRVLQERAVRRVGDFEERKVNVRVVAATHVDLRQAVEAGRFREDLFYRLNVFPIRLPPLRERREDIPMLASFFLDRYADRLGVAVDGLSEEALAALARYPWPGNVRELENAIERALAVTNGPTLTLADLPEEVRGRAGVGVDLTKLEFRDAVNLARDRASREYLVALMRRFEGNVTQAAAQAGIERESLHRLLKKYGVRPQDFRADKGET